MKLFWLFLILFVITVYGKRHGVTKKHAAITKPGVVKRSKLPKKTTSSTVSLVKSMPTLNDEPAGNIETITTEKNTATEELLPGSYGEGDGSGDDDDGDVSVVDDSGAKKPTRKATVKAENAENFGSNVKVKPGVNPSAAFIVREQNHKGFKGKDKTVITQKRSKKKKQQKKKANQKLPVKVSSSLKQKNLQKEDHDIVTDIKQIAKDIDVIEKKKKKEVKKLKNKKTTTTVAINMQDKDVSTKNSHGVGGDVNKGFLANETKIDIDSFECPWSCFWSCHSYCPQECCNNPYNCSMTCREICSPYCKDRCCAPGSRRLDKLSLPFLKPSVKHQQQQQNLNSVGKSLLKPPVPVEQKFSPNRAFTNSLPAPLHFDPEVAFKIKKLKEQSDYAAKLLGFSKCPSLCLKICTPIVCRRECCTRPTQQQQQQNFQAAGIDDKTLQTVDMVQNAVRPKPPAFYCRTPRDCPAGGIVDTNFCPPICRSSCIEQCPNECCPNFGQVGQH